jgi:hypothetical protein
LLNDYDGAISVKDAGLIEHYLLSIVDEAFAGVVEAREEK